jgi:ubiquinone biosynthesis protein
MVEEFERSIKRELDFTIEARTIERFYQNYEDNEMVCIPQAHRSLSTGQVLTMDWIDGVRIDALDQYPVRNSDPKVVSLLGARTLCDQVFRYHLFHADPHPGNVLLTTDNRIAFLDYGMAGHIEQADVTAMADLLRATFEEDAAASVQAMLFFTTEGEVEDTEALEHEIAEYIAFEAQAVLSGGQVGRAIETSIRILRRHRLKLAPRFSLLLKALGTIESTGRALDPHMDMVPIIRPYIKRLVTERFSPLQLLRETRRDALALIHMARDIPADLRQLTKMLRRGRFQVHLQHEKLEQAAASLDRASNRITVGVITGAIIVGSSLLVSAAGGVGHQIGMAGFIVAGLLGIFLVISILRSRNY